MNTLAIAALALIVAQDAEEYVKRGDEKRAQMDRKGAIEEYTKAIEADPKWADPWVKRGRVHAFSFKLDLAIADFDRAIKLDPKFADAFVGRASARRDKGDFDGALADATKAIELEPTWVWGYQTRQSIRLKKGDIDGALADIGKVIEMEPNRHSHYGDRAKILDEKGDLKAAIADYTKAIALTPTDLKGTAKRLEEGRRAAYVSARFALRMELKDYDAAIADCDQVIAEKRSSMGFDFYEMRARAKRGKKDFKGALEDLDTAIESDATDIVCHQRRAEIRAEAGDVDGAIADWTKAIKFMEPLPRWRGTMAEAYVERGHLKKEKGDSQGGASDYAKAIELDPKVGAGFRTRGYEHYDEGSWKLALGDFRKACGCTTEAVSRDYSCFRIWLCRARLGEVAAATAELTGHVKERKPPEGADWALQVARFLTGDLSEADFLKAAASSDAKADREQKCEAYFYAATKRLIAGEKTQAAEYFQKSLDTGVKNFTEYTSSEAELRVLKSQK